jgi:alpha-1,2-mannosyltransferase
VTFCTLLFFYAVRQTFGLGQMNGVLVGLMAVAVALALQQRDAWSGGFIAVAAVLKISPLVLLGFFIVRRRWRALLGAGLTGLAALGAMVMFAGWETTTYFVTQVLPVVGRGSAAFPNQSLLGALYRFSVPWEAIQSSDAIGDYPAIRAVWLVSVIGVLALTGWLTARAQLTERSQVAVGLSVFIVAGLLAGGLTWDHYLLWLALPVSVLIVDWFQERWLRPIGFWALLLIALSAISIPIPLQASLYRTIGPLGSDVSTGGLVVLWILMLWRLQRMQRRQEVA